MEITIIAILWFTMSFLLITQYGPQCKDIPIGDKIAVIIIFLIGGPIFTLANVLEAILGCFLPEGWDDDDFKGY